MKLQQAYKLAEEASEFPREGQKWPLNREEEEADALLREEGKDVARLVNPLLGPKPKSEKERAVLRDQIEKEMDKYMEEQDRVRKERKARMETRMAKQWAKKAR